MLAVAIPVTVVAIMLLRREFRHRPRSAPAIPPIPPAPPDES